MGYEIAGALGVKLAAPERQVVALCRRRLLYLMLSQEIVTAVAEQDDWSSCSSTMRDSPRSATSRSLWALSDSARSTDSVMRHPLASTAEFCRSISVEHPQPRSTRHRSDGVGRVPCCRARCSRSRDHDRGVRALRPGRCRYRRRLVVGRARRRGIDDTHDARGPRAIREGQNGPAPAPVTGARAPPSGMQRPSGGNIGLIRRFELLLTLQSI